MTIEAKLERITVALEAIAAGMSSAAPSEPVAPEPPAVAAAPAPVAPVPAATPAPTAAPVPFNSAQEMTQFVMTAYQQLGPEKGAGIQNVLTNLGYSNINDVQPAHYADLKAGIEALGA